MDCFCEVVPGSREILGCVMESVAALVGFLRGVLYGLGHSFGFVMGRKGLRGRGRS
jgi:hypothetical protein